MLLSNDARKAILTRPVPLARKERGEAMLERAKGNALKALERERLALKKEQDTRRRLRRVLAQITR